MARHTKHSSIPTPAAFQAQPRRQQHQHRRGRHQQQVVQIPTIAVQPPSPPLLPQQQQQQQHLSENRLRRNGSLRVRVKRIFSGLSSSSASASEAEGQRQQRQRQQPQQQDSRFLQTGYPDQHQETRRSHRLTRRRWSSSTSGSELVSFVHPTHGCPGRSIRHTGDFITVQNPNPHTGVMSPSVLSFVSGEQEQEQEKERERSEQEQEQGREGEQKREKERGKRSIWLSQIFPPAPKRSLSLSHVQQGSGRHHWHQARHQPQHQPQSQSQHQNQPRHQYRRPKSPPPQTQVPQTPRSRAALDLPPTHFAAFDPDMLRSMSAEAAAETGAGATAPSAPSQQTQVRQLHYQQHQQREWERDGTGQDREGQGQEQGQWERPLTRLPLHRLKTSTGSDAIATWTTMEQRVVFELPAEVPGCGGVEGEGEDRVQRREWQQCMRPPRPPRPLPYPLGDGVDIARTTLPASSSIPIPTASAAAATTAGTNYNTSAPAPPQHPLPPPPPPQHKHPVAGLGTRLNPSPTCLASASASASSPPVADQQSPPPPPIPQRLRPPTAPAVPVTRVPRPPNQSPTILGRSGPSQLTPSQPNPSQPPRTQRERTRLYGTGVQRLVVVSNAEARREARLQAVQGRGVGDDGTSAALGRQAAHANLLQATRSPRIIQPPQTSHSPQTTHLPQPARAPPPPPPPLPSQPEQQQQDPPSKKRRRLSSLFPARVRSHKDSSTKTPKPTIPLTNKPSTETPAASRPSQTFPTSLQPGPQTALAHPGTLQTQLTHPAPPLPTPLALAKFLIAFWLLLNAFRVVGAVGEALWVAGWPVRVLVRGVWGLGGWVRGR